MAFTARVYNVLIASPGDTSKLRDIVEEALYAWNRDRAETAQTLLRPLRWEFDAVSAMGLDAQSVINEQLVEKADILIGIFYSRLGSATARSASGTAEEIEEAAKAGKRVHVYFSEMPVPRDTAPKDLAALNKFKAELQKRALLGSFASPEDLTARVRTAIEDDVSALAGSAVPELTATPQHAALHATYKYEREPQTDSKGKTTYRTRNERVEIHNTGTKKAERLRIGLEGRDGRDAPSIYGSEEVEPTIPPHGEFGYRLMTHMGTASVVEVVMTWNEDDEEFTDRQTISL